MPFRNDETHLSDILDCIANITDFLGDMSFDAYTNDPKTRSAVERQFQVLTEAAIRLGDNARALCPGIDWTGFRGMGNILRHAYHRIDDQIVWDTVKYNLPPMKEAVEKALSSVSTPPAKTPEPSQ